jgi:Leucine-rich repeat (LRR) protein
MSGNDFYGSLPSAPGFWPGAEFLAARENRFNGTVPSGFSGSLQHLDSASNSLVGEIPAELADYPNLNYLSLSHNDLSSTIPMEAAQIEALEVFQVRNCSLAGFIPTELSSSGAQFLDLGMDVLAGTIHSEFGSISSLEQLSLDSNNLSGRIPPDLGSLELLRMLNPSFAGKLGEFYSGKQSPGWVCTRRCMFHFLRRTTFRVSSSSCV